MRHTFRTRVLLFLSSGALLGCSASDFDESEHVKHLSLSELQPFGVSVDVQFVDGAPSGFAVRLSATGLRPFHDPECPVVNGIAGELDGIPLRAHVGSADEQMDFDGATEVVCQPPELALDTSVGSTMHDLANGEHSVEIWDGSARVKVSFALFSGERIAVAESPEAGGASIGDEITLRVSPAQRNESPASVRFLDSSASEQFFVNIGDGLTWIDDSHLRFVIPQVTPQGRVVVPDNGRLVVFVEGWRTPTIGKCTGATFCQVEEDRTMAPAESVSIPFEIRE